MMKAIPLVLLVLLLGCRVNKSDEPVTMVNLLDEMTDLSRLADLPDYNYRAYQYSSYDRRSTSPSDSGWFSNEDGFGGEPVPGFEKVLKQPDSTGVGEYLICDVRQPGAIVRLWTAGINGRIRLFLDNAETPVYDGDAQDFFWKTAEVLSDEENSPDYADIFRQYDATYFPVPFAAGCRMEWIGDISKIHFYHVGLRLYDKGTKVETFSPSDLKRYSNKIDELAQVFGNPGRADSSGGFSSIRKTAIGDSESAEIFRSEGSRAIECLFLKIVAGDIESALRKSILVIYFDNASVPQVEAPVGDFFGSAPGLNPFQSLPFSVHTDGTMICRFVMPFRKNVRIYLENYSGRPLKVEGKIRLADHDWRDGRSMHFRARWKVEHGITASVFGAGRGSVQDIVYLMASGKGRIVGAAAMVYNPSGATTSWGNWWGEGDEKIFVDSDSFPSFFGTGSEDYFNYSWSSSRIFSYPYCGQPRNDGPGNRGYVSDFRWHVPDDILFSDKIAFFMELGHHGIVPGFSYGRIVYYYALPGTIDDYRKIRPQEIQYLPYNKWDPVAYLGSQGYTYYQAEKLITPGREVKTEKGRLWADSLIVMWEPKGRGDKLKMKLVRVAEDPEARLGLTMSHNPDGGNIRVMVNGQYVKFDGNEFINLFEPAQTTLVNHFSEPVALKKGKNEIILESIDSGRGKKAGVDFLWVKAN